MFTQFNDSLKKLYDKLSSWVDEVVLALPNFILAAIVLAISIFVARHLKKLVTRALLKATDNQTVIGVLSNIVVAAFMILALFVVLNILNLSDAVTALLTGAGVLGLAVGLALQDPLMNLFSGVLMSVKDYYRVGDVVETNGFFGKISKITLRSTVIELTDGQEALISNKDVLNNPLKSFSHKKHRRIDVTCGVSYGDNLEKAKKVALEAVKNSGLKFSKSKPIELFFTGFGDSSIDFTLRFWQDITSQADYLAGQSTAIIAIKKAFDENEITIPFPIRTLDFGVSGGLGIDQIYPPEQFKKEAKETVTTK